MIKTTDKTNIVLIGFMGCGKSVIGKALAKKLEYGFVDCDAEIQRKMDMTIPHIFEEYGEEYFRQIEKEVIRNLKDRNKHIISTGGGAVKNRENINNLKENGVIIYLKSSPEKIYKNILRGDSQRPLLQVEDKLGKIKELLAQREPLYMENSDIVVDLSYLDIPSAVKKVIEIMKLSGGCNFGENKGN